MDLKRASIKDFDTIFTIIEKSFPLNEYRTYQKQKELFNNKRYQVYLSFNSNNEEVNGFVSVWNFDSFTFIEHLAILPNYRNQGIGSKILAELNKKFFNQLCLEVELPNNQIAKRRIEFYKRNGFHVNNYPYAQPPYLEGANEIPMYLMTNQRAINIDEFKRFKATLYKEVYNIDLKQ